MRGFPYKIRLRLVGFLLAAAILFVIASLAPSKKVSATTQEKGKDGSIAATKDMMERRESDDIALELLSEQFSRQGKGQTSSMPMRPVSITLDKNFIQQGEKPEMDIKASSQTTQGWQTIMTEDFEGSFPAGLWALHYNTNSSEEGYGYAWDEDSYRPHDGSRSAWCADYNYEGQSDLDPPGPYPANTNSWMLWGPFDLSDATDAEVLFYFWNYSESGYDGFGWYASTDGSQFYGYSRSGDDRTWSYVNFDLTDVYTLGDITGESQVWIAFIFQSDQSNQYEGAYVDDIEIHKYVDAQMPDLTVPSISWQSNQVTEGSPFGVSPIIKNEGGESAAASHARLFISTDDDFDTSNDYEVLPKKSVPSLAPGEETTLQWDISSFPDLGTGPYEAWFVVQVDADDEVIESNESNLYKTVNSITVQDSQIVLTFNQLEKSAFPTIDCYVTVTDASGNPIGGLTASEFTVQENGMPQAPITVQPMGGAGDPISVALTMDRSGSMAGQKLLDAKAAAKEFVNQMQPNDQGAVISFAIDVTVDQTFTTNKTLLINAIDNLYTSGLTSLYDAIIESVDLTVAQTGRKAIIVMTDGKDNDSNAGIDDAISAALDASIPVYTIGLGNDVSESNLKRIANETGGQYYFSPTSSELQQIYLLISQQLQNQYKITYQSGNPNADCTDRNVQITVDYQGASDTKTKSYKAPCCNITVVEPNSGTIWNEQSSQVIRWNSSGVSGQVDIRYSLDNRSSWTTVAYNEANDGSYNWTLPNVRGDKTDCWIRIMDNSNAACYGEGGPFTIIDGAACLSIIIPNGGESWLPGSEHTISWDEGAAGAFVKLEYTTNGGILWHTIASRTDNDGYQKWLVPSISADSVKVRVINVNNTGCADESDGAFRIGDCPAPYISSSDVTGVAGSQEIVLISIGGNTKPVDAFGFTFTYNPDHLSFVKVAKGDLTQGWVQVNGNETSSGSITIGGYNATAIPTNSSGVIAAIVMDVICSNCVEEKDQSQLRIGNLVDDLVGMNICVGAFQYGLGCPLGDVNMDGAITPSDALCTFQIFLNGGAPPAGGCDTDCAVEAADADCNGVVTPGDALLIFQAFLNGVTQMQCPPVAKASSVARTIHLSDVAGLKGEQVQTTISVAPAVEFKAFGMELHYPSENFDYLGIERADATSGWEALDALEWSDGVIIIGGYDAHGLDKQAATELFRIRFRVKEQSGQGELTVDNLHDDLASATAKTATFNSALAGLAPGEFGVTQNYPNPFNSTTQIYYYVPKYSDVYLYVFDMLGRKVKTLVEGSVEAGTHTVVWDGRDDSGKELSSGVYINKMYAGKRVITKKMILLK